MHHKVVEDILEVDNPTDEQVKEINDRLKVNSIMQQNFGHHKDKRKNKVDEIIYNIKNSAEIMHIIQNNRLELIKGTLLKVCEALYANFCNVNKKESLVLFKDKG